MNAMEHGNQYRPDTPVHISVEESPAAVRVRIADQGGGQFLAEAETPDLDAKLAGLQSPRGWGLFLIEAMVDEMHIHSDDRLPLAGLDVTPAQVMAYWKAHLPELMPDDSRFYPSMTGVKPGEVVLINATLPSMFGAPAMPVSTGVLILYADDESFSVMTPDGHPESGFNTFSALDEEGVTVCQIQSLARANDPIYEFGFRYMGGGAQQEQIWRHVLGQIAQHYGVEPAIDVRKVCVDSRLQWPKAKNVWHNAVIRTTVTAPVRWVNQALGRRKAQD